MGSMGLLKFNANVPKFKMTIDKKRIVTFKVMTKKRTFTSK